MANILQEIKQNDYRFKNKVYTLAYIFIVIKALYAYSEILEPIRYEWVLTIFNVLIISLTVYKMLVLQKYSIKQIFILIAIGLICLYTDRQIQMFQYVPDFLLVAATQDVDFKATMKIIYKIEATFIAVHIAVYPIVYIFNRSALNFSIRGVASDDKLRHQFLLTHANVAGMMILWTILGYLYAEYEQLNRKNIICAWMIYYFTHIFTDSNSGFLILSFVTVILLLKKSGFDWVDNIVCLLSKYLYFILLIFFDFLMIIFPYTTGQSRIAWLAIDNFFTGRLKYGAFAYYKVGFTLFGQPFHMSGKEFWQGIWYDNFACDNGYMWLSVCHGLFYLLLIGFLFWKYSSKAKFEDKLIMIAYALYTMMELYVTYIYFCFALLVVMKYIWSEHESKIRMISS